MASTPRHAARGDWEPLLAVAPALALFMVLVGVLLYAAIHWPAPFVLAATVAAIGGMGLVFRGLALDEPVYVDAGPTPRQ